MTSQPFGQVVRNIDARLTRVEQILPTLATKAELQDLRIEVRQEGERTRRYFDVVAERLEGQIRVLAEGQVALQEQMTGMRAELKADIAQLDRRVMRLEVRLTG